MDDILSRTRYWQAYYLRHHGTPAPQLKAVLHMRDVSPLLLLTSADICQSNSLWTARGFVTLSARLRGDLIACPHSSGALRNSKPCSLHSTCASKYHPHWRTSQSLTHVICRPLTTLWPHFWTVRVLRLHLEFLKEDDHVRTSRPAPLSLPH